MHAVSAGVSSGTETCRRTVGTGVPADLQAALNDAPATPAVCLAWNIELEGTYELTESLVYASALPLQIEGPTSGTARLQAVPAPPATSVAHRILTVDPGSGQVSLVRLILADGDVTTPSAMGDDEGGAVAADELILVDVELIGNRARNGGAVVAADLTATRTSFLGNRADLGSPAAGTGLGGAVLASGQVTLSNVSFIGNVAASGGAVHHELFGTSSGLDATFVTFLDNEASGADEGSDVQLSARSAPGTSGTSSVTLRGVLFGGLAGGTGRVSCAVSVEAETTAPSVTVIDSFGTDGSCGADVSVLGARPDYERVPWLTAGFGLTDLWVPSGVWAGLDAVSCDATAWPVEDQRAQSRPQGDAERCDAGAVERGAAPPPPPPPPPGPLPEAGPEPVVVGPVPTAVPAGGGGCADGCGQVSASEPAARAPRR
jgi:hypothetical protein